MIKLICIGKVKEAYIKEGIAEFTKRLQPFARFEVLELKDSNPKQEGTDILAKVKGTTFLLDETGIEYSSESFAQFLKKQEEKDITFVIGGPNGFDDELKKRFPRIALSKMTFTHEMARLFFIEQLYRAFMILNHRLYHK
jgi:23S rRNA (pseudouridine1915-N3)-methyltransferase